MASATVETVKVALRVRPLSQQEKEEGAESVLTVQSGDSVLLRPPSNEEFRGEVDTTTARHLAFNEPPTPMRTPRRSSVMGTPRKTPNRTLPRQFTFDCVLDGDAGQEEAHTLVDPLLDSVMEGRNATVFAYGSTGAGKTHTILGTKQDRGVLHRSLRSLFARIEGRDDGPYTVYMTYVELYNNTFKDLLATPSTAPGHLSASIGIRENRAGNFLSGSPTLRTRVDSYEHAVELVEAGMRQRSTSRTDLNDRSSRSHVILTLDVHAGRGKSAADIVRQAGRPPTRPHAHTVGCTPTTPRGRPGTAPRTPSRRASCAAHTPSSAAHGSRVSKLHIVDLAGAERVSMSGVDGSALREAQAINLSLSALADVLSALSSAQTDHIPYRNSKLTHLLRDSLGGNARTLMLVHARPTAPHYQQTLTSLVFAARAKTIKNAHSVNEVMAAVREHQNQAEHARELQALRDQLTSAQERMRDHGRERNQLSSENERMRRDLNELMSLAERVRSENDDMAAQLREKERLADPFLFQEVEGLSKRNTALEESAAAMKRALDEAKEARSRSEGTLSELQAERAHLSERASALSRGLEEAMRARVLLKVDADATVAAERLAHLRERGDAVRRLQRELAEAREEASRDKCARALAEVQARRQGRERDAVFSVLKRVLQGAEEQQEGCETERDELAQQCKQLEREVSRRTAQEGRVEEIERDCAERAESEIQRARTRALEAEGMARHLEEQLGTAHWGRKDAERRADDLETQLAKKRDRIVQLKDALLRAKDVIGQQRAVRKRPSDQSTSSAEGEPAAAAAAHEQKRRRKLGGSQGKAAGFTASPDRAESAASQALAEAQEVEPSVQTAQRAL